MSRYIGRELQNLKREAENTDDRMSDSSDSSDSTDSGVSSDSGQSNIVINPRLKIIWHSWHLWPCSLPRKQNNFILIIIWSGDNKTQRNTARECIHAHWYTHRGKRKDVLQCCWKRVTNRAPNEFFGTFYHMATKHADVTKHAGRTSQYDTGW